jgi:hypothetical protein
LIRAAEWLGAAHEFMAEWGFVPVREGYEQARKSVDRALELEPRNPKCLGMLAKLTPT